MKKILVSFVLFLATTTIHAASIGSWKAYLAYTDITEIEKAGHELFVLASKNLYLYNTQDNSVRTFSKMDALSDCSIAHIAWNQKAKRLVVVYENKNIDLLEANGNCTNMPEYYMKSVTGDKSINDIYNFDQFAYLSTGFGILKINVSKAEISDTYQLGFKVNYCYIENGKIFAASETNGLFAANLNSNLLDKSNWNRVGDYAGRGKNIDPELLEIVKNANPDGPKYGNFGFMKFVNNELYTCSGGYGEGIDFEYRGLVQVLNNNGWKFYQDSLNTITNIPFVDMTTLAVDPTDKGRVFTAGRTGLYEYKDGLFKNLHSIHNSLLGTALHDNTFTDQQKMSYTLVEGVTFDPQGNLWCLNSQAKGVSLLEYTKDKQWIDHTKPETIGKNDGNSFAHLQCPFFDSRGLLWFVNNHSGDPSLFRYNPVTDEMSWWRKSFTNQDGTIVSVENVRFVTEDKNGNIWVGTNMGPLMIEAKNAANDITEFIQVKVPRNDGTNYADYLLSGVDIISIAVDDANRKWFGTAENGVYLISDDNIQQLQHFTSDNSLLLSDYIGSIAINNNTGEVFFGTDKGLCSYMSDATTAYETMDKDHVYAYPNPVKPDYTGIITIVGLSYNADVKIVTVNGALVAEGRSNGGTFTWDGRDQTTGRRVASGVYMVMAATADGNKGTVCKIAIIR